MTNLPVYLLPKVYLDFYKRCRRKRPESMIGSDLRNDSEELNEWAIELLEESGIENFLKDTDFVFMMHQGYMFWYFDTNGGENPHVYFYHENWPKPVKHYRFSEFLEKHPQRLSGEA